MATVISRGDCSSLGQSVLGTAVSIKDWLGHFVLNIGISIAKFNCGVAVFVVAS